MARSTSSFALVVGHEPAWCHRVSTEFERIGWRVMVAVDPQTHGLGEAILPELVVIEAATPVDQRWLEDRRRDGVVVLAAGMAPPAFACDAIIADEGIAATLAMLGIAPGQDLPDATRRLYGLFGQGTIDAMLLRFAALLAEALSGGGGEPDRGLAHRVAGVAGTLGFGELGARWRAVSDATESADETLVVATRMAIGTIRRTCITGSP